MAEIAARSPHGRSCSAASAPDPLYNIGMKFSPKKFIKMFGSSDFVVTFASAFAKKAFRADLERALFEKCDGSKKCLEKCLED